MTDPRLQSFLTRLRDEYPEYVVAIRPYRLEENETLEHFINLLMVPVDRLHDVAWHATGIALDVYGDDPIPFAMTTVSPETSAEHYAKELAEARADRLFARMAPVTPVRAQVAAPSPALTMAEAPAPIERDSSPDWTATSSLADFAPLGHLSEVHPESPDDVDPPPAHSLAA